MVAVDLFAGPGGWDVAALSLGFEPLGVEWDDAACATRRAAGLRTLQANVSGIDPKRTVVCELGTRPVELLIGSPPCQSFSMAGKGDGRRALDAYAVAMEQMWERGAGAVDRGWLDEQCADPRGHLVLEPLRWAMELSPRAIALEQVEPVLPLWEKMAVVLARLGYQTWTGVLSSEQFGVAQTRRRAFLIASLDSQPRCPPASHQRWIAPRVKAKQEESLFAVPEPGRIVAPEDRDLLPWISMGEALGWGMTGRPYPVIAGGTGGGPDLEKVGGSAAREVIYGEMRAGRWTGVFEPTGGLTKNGNHVDGEWIPDVSFRANAQANAAVRSLDEPAPTITGGHDHGERQWIIDTGCTHSGATPDGGRTRAVEEPAPTVTGRADQLEWRSTHYDSRGQRDGRTGEMNRQRSVLEPTPTIAGESRNDRWVLKAGTGEHEAQRVLEEPAPTLRFGARLNTVAWTAERPATTVAGDPRVFPPGHKVNGEDEAAGRSGQQRSGAGPADGSEGAQAVRVSLAEALVLQSFAPDYPVQGTKTAQFRQVGDAVPPLLARAVLLEALRCGR